ncbi:TraB/GumN family protein, partial [Thermodesulfovibrionales bacterium]|nr:TraB/GumN family protein [Thermodesulfovibrionales bacterium]
GKVLLLLAQIIMTSFYRRLGRRIGVRPGAEMIKGIEMARKNGAELVLADRDIEITLKRVWRYLNLWDKIQILAQLIISLFAVGRIDKQAIEDMKNQDQLEAMMESVGELLPEIKKRLLDERDVYLAQKIRNAPGTTIVAVVGAAHVSGILQHIYRDMPTEPLMEIPPKSIVIPILKWTIPIIIITLLIVGFLKGGTEHSIESIKDMDIGKWYFLCNWRHGGTCPPDYNTCSIRSCPIYQS